MESLFPKIELFYLGIFGSDEVRARWWNQALLLLSSLPDSLDD